METGERQQIVTEIQRLLDEQMEALRVELTPEILIEYKDREDKIRKLVARIVSPEATQ